MYAGASLSLNSGDKSKCMHDYKFTFGQRKEKQMYSRRGGANLPF